MVYDNLTYHPSWISIVNIALSVVLILLFLCSFLRTWFSCKGIEKKYCLCTHTTITKKRMQINLFVISIFSEIIVYLYFCISFGIRYFNYPANPIIGGLSVIVWEYDTRFEGIIKYLAGVIFWFALNSALTVTYLYNSEGKLERKNRFILGLLSSVRNFPFYLLFQIPVIIYGLHFVEMMTD